MMFCDLHILTAVVRRQRDTEDRKWTRSTNVRRNGIGWKKIDGRSATLLISSLTSRFVAALSASMIAQVRDQRLGMRAVIALCIRVRTVNSSRTSNAILYYEREHRRELESHPGEFLAPTPA